MKKQYILPAVLFFLGATILVYVKKKEKTATSAGEELNKEYSGIGILGTLLFIAGTAMFLYRWR